MRSSLVVWTVVLALGATATWVAWAGDDEPDGVAEPPSFPPVRIEQGEEVTRQYEAILNPTAGTPDVEAPALLETPSPPPPPDEAVRLLLEDEDGNALAGVKARLSLLPGRLAGRAWRPAIAECSWQSFQATGEAAFAATSDANGELAFPGVPRMRRYRIDVPAQQGLAHRCLLGSTHSIRLTTTTLAPAARRLELQVAGLPPQHRPGSVILREEGWAGLRSPVISTVHAWCVVPLAEDGTATTPMLPDVPLVADVIVPDVGIRRGLTVRNASTGFGVIAMPLVPTMTLRGVLRDAEGEPVPRAGLTLAVQAYLKRHPARAWLRRAVSDEKGRFAFADVPVGRVEGLHVVADGFVAPRRILAGAPLLPDETLDVPLQLVPGASVAGMIRDPEGNPLSGVRVRSSARASHLVMWDAPDAWSDAEGRYRIDGCPPGRCTLTFSGRVGGRTVLEIHVRRQAVTRVQDAVLQPVDRRGAVTVRVVDARGKPVSGAAVAHRSQHGNMSGTVHGGTTDAKGLHRISGIRTDVETFSVWAYKAGASTVARAVEPSALVDEATTVRLLLPDVGRIRGKVLRGTKPAQGVRVGVEDTRIAGVTDRDGGFLLRGVPPGEHRVQALSGSRKKLGKAVPVRVAAGGVAEVALVVPAEDADVMLRGRLVDGAGRGLAGVVLSAGSSSPWRASPEVETDADGRFAIPVARRGDHPLCSGDLRLKHALSAGLDDARVVFDPATIPIVQGRAFDEEGRPAYAMGASVRVDGSGREPECEGAGGFFRMSLLERPTKGLTLEVPHVYRDRWGRSLAPRVDPVPFQPGDTVVLRRKTPEGGAGATIRGFVVDPEGNPVPTVRLTLNGRSATSTSSRSVHVRSDGTFEARDAPAGALSLHAVGPRPLGWTTSPVPVDPSAGPVRVVLSRIPAANLVTVRGRVVDEDDRPIAGLHVRLEAAAEPAFREATSGPDGRFVFEHVLRGRATVTASPFQEAAGISRAVLREVEAEVVPEAGEVVLRIPIRSTEHASGHEVIVVLVDPEGQLVPGTRPIVALTGLGDLDGVERSPASRGPFGRADGSCPIADVPPGRYRLTVRFAGVDAPYLPVPAREIRVPPLRIEVALTRAAELHGRLRGDDVAGYCVALHAGDAWTMQTVSESGAFAFHVDPEATFVLTAHHPGRAAYAVVEELTAKASPHTIALDRRGLEIAGRLVGYVKLPRDYRLTIDGGRYRVRLELDEEGRFRVLGVPPGEYEIRFDNWDFDLSPDDGDIRMRVTAGDTNVVLERRKSR